MPGSKASQSQYSPQRAGKVRPYRVVGDADGYESPTETPAELQNFPLSKARLNKSNIVPGSKASQSQYSPQRAGKVRPYRPFLNANAKCALQLHRVYAPSTHSLPIIKCVAGVDGEAEVEIKSCTTYHRKSPLGVFCGSFQGDFIRSGVFTGPYPLIQRRSKLIGVAVVYLGR
jgi:hypothetical protein